jgi:anthranilate synthase component II
MILLVDNYDSFTYNLVHLIGKTNVECLVRRNDQISVEEALGLSAQAIVLSPGPCSPDQAGVCLDLVKAASENDIPLLGVCLGHQSIGQAFGGRVTRCPTIMHGKISRIKHTGHALFDNIPASFDVTRYHSLHVEPDTIPECLEVIAQTDDGIVMAFAHTQARVYGVQFHPESIASEYGEQLIRNFLKLAEIDTHVV